MNKIHSNNMLLIGGEVLIDKYGHDIRNIDMNKFQKHLSKRFPNFQSYSLDKQFNVIGHIQTNPSYVENFGSVDSKGQTLPKIGNAPPRTYDHKTTPRYEETVYSKRRGKPYPMDRGYDLPYMSTDSAQRLNITNHNVGEWESIVGQWADAFVAHYESKGFKYEVDQLIAYMENYLGETAKNLWLNYKKKKTSNFEQLRGLGSNVYNVVNRVNLVLTGTDMFSGSIQRQTEAARKLDQLSIAKAGTIDRFLREYVFLSALKGSSNDALDMDRLFNSIPAPLGFAVVEEWKKSGIRDTDMDSVQTRVNFINKVLQSKCADIKITRQIQEGSWGDLCKNVYVPYPTEDPSRQYRHKSHKRHRHKTHHPERRTRKRYYTRRSNRDASDRRLTDRHARRYNSKRNYKGNPLRCYVCDEEGHFSNKCPKRTMVNSVKAQVTNDTKEVLLDLGPDVSDTETIVSIVSLQELEDIIQIDKLNTAIFSSSGTDTEYESEYNLEQEFEKGMKLNPVI